MGAGDHGLGEGFLRLGQLSRIALSPELELAIRRSRPEQILGALALSPKLGRLTQLVAKNRAFVVLGAPPHETRPAA